MPKIFTTYCTLLVIALAAANYKGYVLTSIFSTTNAANKAANHYHK